MAHTFSNREVLHAQDIFFLNDLMTRRQTTKPDLVRELKVYREVPVKSYRPTLHSRQYLRRISQKTVLAYLPQPCATSHDTSNAQRSLYARRNELKTRDRHILVRSGRPGSQAGP
jgi:hypothetical protein